MELVLPDAVATGRLGQWLGRSLSVGTVLLLRGDLGSGKTTLVQGIGAGLGITEMIDSPTFTLVNEYLTGRLSLYHVDLYRLEASGVESLHLEIYWEGIEVKPGIVAIEWADKLSYWPPQPLLLDLTYAGEKRQAALQPSTLAQAQLLTLLSPDELLADEV
ncbi:MAG: tRNA (adenosine(37)-N6)-threonylcarbamoyltransferase complex ATPase subunit type 1 TsaE [Leptolyngbyaceae cyanobacterium SM1_1_3]|nr:tRNA (adenosine(37)-N6)-threonylcarbamoyltransferase complex ATPase subunit type 1 TsaE [Leptolyngbyaceae cyanobacterium SM1_1_3]NJN01143.1 tRNA (adenosine(37)-N6)-threonylcarbamoyltransferase complex ATPase subunit type 1 TsaE [Leptolyngbyaceae cyanobacterium RM1_1_2]NJO09277.1 tRNA (adenosine(37)-N6)-threonylcarbamoyltransferase complex ATPase subunit type 1 TsaE [Leptolyngbyaceae cyanobacterium SL_1_1]